ncbi:Oidioi.mRNA.OKI2018_I69.PAR.g10861.t1.cds [Oikopleura dioica]|uniref:Oidioi.mRNA.OKI2018_I69.PAR.g10861.t1.cds n=1 Tax=Oikopleura dioica TaxID=34765 RepID=A0ABN7S026_OIKDI|nr:Oidioi.mRNA.OKI2018_I69.PAR.g10861.t1.cds [Oikopleura dioica]
MILNKFVLGLLLLFQVGHPRSFKKRRFRKRGDTCEGVTYDTCKSCQDLLQIQVESERGYSENETGRRMPPRMKRMAKYCRNLWEPAELLIKSPTSGRTPLIIHPH